MSAPAAPPALPAPPAFTDAYYLGVLRAIRDQPESRSRINAQVLPFLYQRLRQTVAFLIEGLFQLDNGVRVLDVFDDQDLHGPEGTALLESTDELLTSTTSGFYETGRWFGGVSAIMMELERFHCLSDENRATFEDLMRLAADFAEDMRRIREELGRMRSTG